MIPSETLAGAQYPLCPSSIAERQISTNALSKRLLATALGRAKAYLDLTKPTIQLLVVLTGAAALVYDGSLLLRPERFALALFALALSAGSAKALNQYIERHVDARMERTRSSRPLPQGLIAPTEALVFALILGITAIALFAYFFNPLSAILAVATILFYSLFYTLYLKPNTPYSIVIGGIAGSMGPVISWAATGSPPSGVPLLMFLVVFCWTPPHFWALAYCHREDFKKAGYPMLPTTVSRQRFWQLTWLGGAMTLMASLALGFVGAGIGYLTIAAIAGVIFLKRIWEAGEADSVEKARGVFVYSMVYLVTLFAALIIDRVM